MARISFVFATCLLVSASNGNIISNVNPEARIIGGTTAKFKDFPFMALITFHNVKNGELEFCSASILSEDYLMTAAHCLYK